MITANQGKLIAKLLEGKKIKESAEELGIGERTAQRWHKEPEFQQAYGEERLRRLNQSIATMQLKFDNAIETLDRHTNATKTIPRDQIKAAEVIVDKVLQTAELAKRIKELETQLAIKEQMQQDMLMINARLLTKDERSTIEVIIDRVLARGSIVVDGSRTTE